MELSKRDKELIDIALMDRIEMVMNKRNEDFYRGCGILQEKLKIEWEELVNLLTRFRVDK